MENLYNNGVIAPFLQMLRDTVRKASHEEHLSAQLYNDGDSRLLLSDADLPVFCGLWPDAASAGDAK